jgi:hypothetical protein
MVSTQHVETADFDRYIQLFDNGLTERQVQLINELVMDKPPAMAGDTAGEAEYVAPPAARLVAPIAMSSGGDNILCWNVRGLNGRGGRNIVYQLVANEQPSNFFACKRLSYV